MKIAYVDCIGGVSGDMLLGTLVDAGVKPAALRRELGKLSLPGWKLDVNTMVKNGVRATKATVVLGSKAPRLNTIKEVESILHRSSLLRSDQQRVMQVFSRLAKVEARVHGTSVSRVHFHEIGSIDTMIDIVGAVCGFRLLGIKRIHVSPFPIAHVGPATLELIKDYPSFGVEEEHETVTPTGASILTTLATTYGPLPPMIMKRVGYGAGQQELNRPNVLRFVIGETRDADTDISTESLVVLETNIDDLNPQMYDYICRKLFDAGALDVWMTPIQMKKQRPGVLLSALSAPEKSEGLMNILFEEGVTLGVRRSLVERMSLPREMVNVKTRYGPVHVKIARFRGRVVRTFPEYDDCLQIATMHNVPILKIFRLAQSKVKFSS